jgi:hypothetical protein
MYKLKKLIQTSGCMCPSIWEGWTDDDKWVFIRCRWDKLRMTISKTKFPNYETPDDYTYSFWNDAEFIKIFDVTNKGVINTEDVVEYFKEFVDFSEVKK